MSSPEQRPGTERTVALPQRELEELYGLLLAGIREYAIFLLDPDGRVVSWTSGAEDMKGYTEHEILGRHYSIFYPADAAAAGVPGEHLAMAAREGSAVYEGWRVRKDGSRFWASIVSTAIIDGSGRLRGFGKVTRDTTRRHVADEDNRRRALHDPLTDLPNRGLVGDRLDQALSRLGRRETGLAVLFLDLNGFKHINDTYGHAAGDSVLEEVARRLVAAVRPEDTVGRMGGDEFVAVCEDLAGAPAALAVAHRIMSSFSRPVSLGTGEQVPVSLCIGIAMTTEARTPGQAVLRRADAAMYAAKRVGGTASRVHLAGGDTPA